MAFGQNVGTEFHSWGVALVITHKFMLDLA
jgi:hypothetical protein